MAVRRGFLVEALNPSYRIIGGNVVIGGAGAVSSQDTAKQSGATVTKTAAKTGRYSVLFDRTYKRVVSTGSSMFGPADAAFPTTTGASPKQRNRATTGFDIQFVREDTQADAEPASGTSFDWWAVVALN
jgi:hypothetical protein